MRTLFAVGVGVALVALVVTVRWVMVPSKRPKVQKMAVQVADEDATDFAGC